MTILFVTNQISSKNFYSSVLKIEPILDVPGMTEFPISTDFSLGLMPGQNIKTILQDKIPHPDNAAGIPRCELYFIVPNPKEHLNLIGKNGGEIISDVEARSWGDKVGYGIDLDGHLIAFAEKM